MISTIVVDEIFLCLTDVLSKLSVVHYDKTHSGVTCISMQLDVSARVIRMCACSRVCKHERVSLDVACSLVRRRCCCF